VCLAFPIKGRHGDRYLVTGRPVQPPVTDRAAARRRFGLVEEDTCVLVFGGSLGARTINEAAITAFAGAGFHVLHVAGSRDYEALRRRVPAERYDLREYITPFGDALAASDLCVARAGGSIFEIAAHARPAILIPYPYAAGDHQTSNAEWMRRAGAAVVIPDEQLTAERLAREVGELLGDPGRLRAMGRASAGLARPDAAQVVADELVAAARER
jgi:UDP-N-acetylglucosamine--N-acetylmuramyl-(pentapeptide) pyrophosphoryl-undecaprenol N-acetylglucosamine transferase